MYATLLAVTLLAANQAPESLPGVFRVNCDAGQSLALALKRAERFPGAEIRIRGTCRGSFVVKTDGLQLVGVSPEQSKLAAPAQPTGAALLEVQDARGVSVRGLGIEGGYIGVRFERSPGGAVVDSEFKNNGLALYYLQTTDGYVRNAALHDNDAGLVCDTYSAVSVSATELRDNRIQGAAASRYSFLGLIDSQVTGNGSVGATASIHSSLTLWNTSFADNGEIHVFASDRSALRFVSGIALGSPSDTTPFSAGIDEDSSLHSGTEAQFYGDVLVAGTSYLQLATVRVNGVIRASQFARVALYSTEVTQPALCETGADLVCGWPTIVTGFGCPSAAASCTAPPSAPARPGALTPPALDPRSNGIDAPWAPTRLRLGGAAGPH